MRRYRFFSKTEEGEDQEGILEAASREEAQGVLTRRDLVVVRLEEVREGQEAELRAPLPELAASFVERRIGAGDLADLSYELAVLLEAGVTLPEALGLYIGDSRSALDQELRGVVEEVRGGAPFSQTLAKRGDTFPPVFSALVRSGEQAGALPSVLKQVANYFENIETARGQMVSSAAYPLVIVALALGVLVPLLLYIVPVFARIYDHMGVELPAATRAFLALGEHRILVLALVAALVVGGFLFFRVYGRTPGGRVSIDRLKLSIPLLSCVFRDMAMTSFTLTLGMLYENGLKIHEGIELAAEACGNRHLQGTLKKLRQGVHEGQNLSDVMDKSHLLDPKRLGMIRAGERSGALGTVLIRLSEILYAQADRRVRRLLSLMEPVLVVLIGLVVGGSVIALAAPILNLSSFINP